MTRSYYLTTAVVRYSYQQQLSKQQLSVDLTGKYFVEVLKSPINESYLYSLNTFNYYRDQGILGYLSFLNFRTNKSDSNSSILIRLRLVVLLPIRINAEEILNEANKLNLGLALNEEDKKELIISHNPTVDSGKY